MAYTLLPKAWRPRPVTYRALGPLPPKSFVTARRQMRGAPWDWSWVPQPAHLEQPLARVTQQSCYPVSWFPCWPPLATQETQDVILNSLATGRGMGQAESDEGLSWFLFVCLSSFCWYEELLYGFRIWILNQIRNGSIFSHSLDSLFICQSDISRYFHSDAFQF